MDLSVDSNTIAGLIAYLMIFALPFICQGQPRGGQQRPNALWVLYIRCESASGLQRG